MKIIKLTNETQESNDVKRKIIDCLERIDEREISSIQNSFIVNLLDKKSKQQLLVAIFLHVSLKMIIKGKSYVLSSGTVYNIIILIYTSSHLTPIYLRYQSKRLVRLSRCRKLSSVCKVSQFLMLSSLKINIGGIAICVSIIIFIITYYFTGLTQFNKLKRLNLLAIQGKTI